MDRVFLGLAGRLLEISLGLRPLEVPRRSPASPWKTPSIPPLLLGLTNAQTAAQHQYNVSYEARMSGKCGEWRN